MVVVNNIKPHTEEHSDENHNGKESAKQHTAYTVFPVNVAGITLVKQADH
jgi:hypothetical protein